MNNNKPLKRLSSLFIIKCHKKSRNLEVHLLLIMNNEDIKGEEDE